MKKIKQYIKKHDEIFFLILFFIIILGNNIYIVLNQDDLWNFQNIYKMYNGYKIYIDANVITTPLFHTIGLIIFKILGANFFIYHLYGTIINLLLALGTYKIFKSLKISKTTSILLTSIIFIIEYELFKITNYNNLYLTLIAYGIIIALNRKKYTTNKFIIIETIIAFLILMTKQNVGIVYYISLIIYNLIYEKESKQKNILQIIVISIALTCIFIITLYKIGILEGFVSYSILGIKEFASKNLTHTILHILLTISIFITPLVLTLIFNKKLKKEKELIKNINILAIFSIPLIIIAYPIFNNLHIQYASYYILILLIYISYYFIQQICKNYTNNRNIIKYITTIILIALTIISITKIILFIKENTNKEYSNIYYGISTEKIERKMNNVIEYIKEDNQKIIILSTEAGIYMMPLKASNGNMDEPLLGNLGKEGEDGIIKQISQMKNTKILINTEKKNYQESDKIREYIKNSLKYIGKIEDLLIYQTK